MGLIKKITNLLKYNRNVRVHGKNNQVETKYYKNLLVKIYGDNNTVIIKDTKLSVSGTMLIGCYDNRVNNCKIEIGENLLANGFTLLVMEDNTNVKIGKNCMMSSNITFFASDAHSVIDNNGKVINCGKYINIGDHVWIGYNATVCKNISIANNCIIGTGSVVTKSCDRENCVIAGNPAKIVKENINWDSKRPKQYIVSMENM